MNVQRNLRLVQAAYRQVARKAATTEGEVPNPRFYKLKEIQKKFQVDDGLPVHLKGGFRDTILLDLTYLMVFIGLGMSANTVYKLAFPKQ
ncbi:cytochrome c oxidase subunit 7A2, mitochondrial-like [Cylas formicarius]|uniref:cytochrome c oxidase subunit 7A2, mitochondrial-like n=1 Tax=Cylas formicarius TaxID=197179 RepID=UPI0029588510|nr:cytochrome c oxidase subunit 7A2, mitochondrial-like [Cylas formicarius]